MLTEYPDGSITCETYIKAIDLIKIADQMLKDDMKYVKIIIHDSYDDDVDGRVDLLAIPSPDSNEVKKYPSINGMITLEFWLLQLVSSIFNFFYLLHLTHFYINSFGASL